MRGLLAPGARMVTVCADADDDLSGIETGQKVSAQLGGQPARGVVARVSKPSPSGRRVVVFAVEADPEPLGR